MWMSRGKSGVEKKKTKESKMQIILCDIYTTASGYILRQEGKEETGALYTTVTSLSVSDIITKGTDTGVTSELVLVVQPQDM